MKVARNLKRNLKKAAQSALRNAGFELINLKHNDRFGWDWIRDTRRLASLFQYPITTVFDVGSNRGQTALELRREFVDAEIHCFEPTPSTYSELVGAVAGDRRIHTHPLALGATPGTATLRCFPGTLINTIAPDAPFMQRFPDAVATSTGTAEVSVATVDDICSQRGIERVSLLKIDTEGFDLDVLRGATKMLGAGRIDFVVMEITCAAPASVADRGNLVSAIDLLHADGLRFVATYTDGIAKSLPLYLLSNALFVRTDTNGARGS